jgi:hypothetical protein
MFKSFSLSSLLGLLLSFELGRCLSSLLLLVPRTFFFFVSDSLSFLMLESFILSCLLLSYSFLLGLTLMLSPCKQLCKMLGFGFFPECLLLGLSYEFCIFSLLSQSLLLSVTLSLVPQSLFFG